MKKRAIHILLLFTGTVLAASCVEPYQPKLSEDFKDILVIDAFLDATTRKAAVTLTHAMKLDNTQGAATESAAQVTVEEQSGSSYPLQEIQPGQYETTGLNIDFKKQYRLTVKTKDGKTYQSAYITIQQTPAIDSITWKPNDQGITLYANTHGNTALNSTGYYQWSFTETWEYTSRYYSSVIFKDGMVTLRPRELDTYYCWKTVPSTGISVGTSKKLSEDVIREFPLTRVPRGSYQLSRTYSINVQQRSLTEEGYNYWLQLQKTTENGGGLFDPLPGQVTGNFTCLNNPDEPVLGFFSGCTTDEKRLFIGIRDLPRYLQLAPPYPACAVDSIPIAVIRTIMGELYLIDSYGMGPAGYLSTARSCIDCTTMGGVTKRPEFWQ